MTLYFIFISFCIKYISVFNIKNVHSQLQLITSYNELHDLITYNSYDIKDDSMMHVFYNNILYFYI